jgi:hypothetical protein
VIAANLEAPLHPARAVYGTFEQSVLSDAHRLTSGKHIKTTN